MGVEIIKGCRKRGSGVDLEQSLPRWVRFLDISDVHDRNAALCCFERPTEDFVVHQGLPGTSRGVSCPLPSCLSPGNSKCEGSGEVSPAWPAVILQASAQQIAATHVKMLAAFREKVDAPIWNRSW